MTAAAEQTWVYLDIGEVVEAQDLEVTVAVLPLPDDEIGPLLAAAPQVLHALECLLMAVEVDGVPGIGQATDRAKEAIWAARQRLWVSYPASTEA